MSKLFYPYMMNRSAPTVHNHRRLGLHLQREGAGQDARSRPGIKAIHIMLKYFFSSMDSAVVNQCEAFMEEGGGGLFSLALFNLQNAKIHNRGKCFDNYSLSVDKQA